MTLYAAYKYYILHTGWAKKPDRINMLNFDSTGNGMYTILALVVNFK